MQAPVLRQLSAAKVVAMQSYLLSSVHIRLDQRRIAFRMSILRRGSSYLCKSPGVAADQQDSTERRPSIQHSSEVVWCQRRAHFGSILGDLQKTQCTSVSFGKESQASRSKPDFFDGSSIKRGCASFTLSDRKFGVRPSNFSSSFSSVKLNTNESCSTQITDFDQVFNDSKHYKREDDHANSIRSQESARMNTPIYGTQGLYGQSRDESLQRESRKWSYLRDQTCEGLSKWPFKRDEQTSLSPRPSGNPMDIETPQKESTSEDYFYFSSCSVFCSGPRCFRIAREHVTDPENKQKIIGFCSESCAAGWKDLWLLRVSGR